MESSLTRCWIFFVLLFYVAQVQGGFLDMPDIQEMPEAENDILLKDLDIPNVRDRSPNPDAGPRLNVTAFRIQGIVEFPELGITREKLIELVESIRYDMMEEGDLLYSGYTLNELSELQDMIVDIEKQTRHQHVTEYDLQRLVFLIRDQRRSRGVTLGMLENVADEITQYYRQRGFFLAKAFVPEQEVRDGIVTLTLLLGTLGDAPLNNSKLYKQASIDRIFGTAYGKPVTNDAMEERLYYVNDLPGMSVQGFFAPGTQVGDTRLNINSTRESRYNASVRSDNHGSDVTGEYRIYSEFLLNNPLGYGDQLHLSLLGAAVPESSTYGSIGYRGPLFHYRWSYDAKVSRNVFSLAFEQDREVDIDIGGVSKSQEVGVQYQLSRNRVKTSALGMRVSRIDASVKFIKDGNSSEFNRDVTQNLTLLYSFDVLNEASRSVHVGTAKVVYSEVLDSLQRQLARPEDTWFVTADYTMLRFVKLPFFSKPARFVTRAGVQYAGKRLVSVNQFALTGPTRARGFKGNLFFADDAGHLGLDIIFDRLPFGWLSGVAQPYVFADMTYGKAHLEGASKQSTTAELGDLGFGLKVSPSRGVRGSVSIATPVIHHISNDFEEKEYDGVKVFLDFQYNL